MENSLSLQRKKASDLSLGTSHDVIYDRGMEILRSLPRQSEHLDFGSGKGVFLKRLYEEGLCEKLTGIDMMPVPSQFPTEISWRQADLNQTLPFPDGLFGSISALEIIEHLENPRHVLRELYRVLRPQGWVLLSTPNNESLRAILSYSIRGHFVAFTKSEYPAHITALNRLDLSRAAQETQFAPVEFQYSENGCLPGFTHWTWQKISGGFLKGLRFSDNLFLILQKN